MTRFAKTFAAPAVLAAAALCAPQASAAVLPYARHSAQVTETSQYGGWGGWGHHRRRDRVDAGDILTGVLILGGIAAVASAVSKSKERERSYPYPRYPDQRPQYRTDARGIDGAVDMCVREVERNSRVANVDRVERDANGWRVMGSMATGGSFDCSIGADGRIERLDVGTDRGIDSGASYGTEDRQYGDDAYYSARARIDGGPAAQSAQPAYPGGPLPGDDEAELPEYPGA